MRGCCTWARYYDPQVGRFISRDAVLSEHPYLYCEHDPVNYVDPSGNIPQWVKDYAKAAWEWTKEHASDIGKGIGIVVGTLVGIQLAEELYVVYVDWDCSNRMRRMMREWGQIPEGPIAEYMDNLFMLLCCDDTRSDRRHPPSKPTTHTKHPQQHKNCDASYKPHPSPTPHNAPNATADYAHHPQTCA
jgi:hypothetical protein